MDLKAELGNIDIYLLDQVLRGHVPGDAVVLDAGCGGGRNLYYFLKSGHPVHGVDADPSAIARVRELAAGLGCLADEQRFRVEPVESISFEAESFDLVICNAVLHFARDEAHFRAMADALHRVTRRGGLCFCRLASTIGLGVSLEPIEGRWYHLPDGTRRFLVDLDFLLAETERLGVELVDPIKTVNVQNLRCMTNWVWRKMGGQAP